ncbi:MAG: hypothetical protein AB8B58_06985 [Roseobacter sp.]
MASSQTELHDLARRHTKAWNSKVPAHVAASHTPISSIVTNRGEPSVDPEGLAAMVAGFHTDAHAIYTRTLTGHHHQTGNPRNVQG